MGKVFTTEERIVFILAAAVAILLGYLVSGLLTAFALGCIVVGIVAKIRKKRGYADQRYAVGAGISLIGGLVSSIKNLFGFIIGEIVSHLIAKKCK